MVQENLFWYASWKEIVVIRFVGKNYPPKHRNCQLIPVTSIQLSGNKWNLRPVLIRKKQLIKICWPETIFLEE